MRWWCGPVHKQILFCTLPLGLFDRNHPGVSSSVQRSLQLGLPVDRDPGDHYWGSSNIQVTWGLFMQCSVKMNYQYHTKWYHLSHCYKAAFSLGKPLFEMCWFHMGTAQRALDPPPFCQMSKLGTKSAPKPSWQALSPPGKRGEKKCYYR